MIDDYLLYVHTGARVAGSVSIDHDSEGAWPLPPGEYEVHYLIDDGYLSAGHVSFGVLP